MPMMRDTPPPLPADVLRELRTSLAANFGHKLVESEGRIVLAIHVPGDVPDRERDVVRAADVVAEEEVAVARDVLLIGESRLIRLDPMPLRDAVRERMQEDLPVCKEIRRGVAREFGASLFQPATRRDVAIAVRVPRAYLKEITPEDLAAINTSLQPVLAQPHAQRAGMCYLVSDNDYRRAIPEEFARILRGEVPLKPPRVNNYVTAGDSKAGRAAAALGGLSGSPFGMLVSNTVTMDAKMEKTKAAKQAKPEAPAPAPAPAPPAPVPAASLTPSLVTVTPPTLPPAGMAAPASLAAVLDPLAALGSKLGALGFEVLTEVADLGIALAAHQPNGKRIIVQRAPTATPDAVAALAKACGELDADAGILLADELAPGAWLAAAGTKVEVLPTAAVDAWTW